LPASILWRSVGVVRAPEGEVPSSRAVRLQNLPNGGALTGERLTEAQRQGEGERPIGGDRRPLRELPSAVLHANLPVGAIDGIAKWYREPPPAVDLALPLRPVREGN